MIVKAKGRMRREGGEGPKKQKIVRLKLRGKKLNMRENEKDKNEKNIRRETKIQMELERKERKRKWRRKTERGIGDTKFRSILELQGVRDLEM